MSGDVLPLGRRQTARDAAQQAQRVGLVAVVAVGVVVAAAVISGCIDHALERRLGQRNGERDGLVELASTRLDGHDGRDGHPVAEHLHDEVVRNGHGLQRQLDLLLQRLLGKERLGARHNRGRDHAARLADRVRLVADARHERKVLGKVARDDARESQRASSSGSSSSSRDWTAAAAVFVTLDAASGSAERLVDGVVGGQVGVLEPLVAVVAAQHDNLALFAAQ